MNHNGPDYLLIKDLPGYKKGCIFSIGDNYIYYISYIPDTIEWVTIDDLDDEKKIQSGEGLTIKV